MTAAERQELIEQYARGPRRIRDAWSHVPDVARAWRPAEGKWSAHEVVCHCADSETNAALRIRYLFAEREPRIIGYDQDAWAAVLQYEQHPVETALATIDAVRANTVPLIRGASEELWLRAGTHTEHGRYAATDWLRIYAEHLEIHARQIERNIEAWERRTLHER